MAVFGHQGLEEKTGRLFCRLCCSLLSVDPLRKLPQESNLSFCSKENVVYSNSGRKQTNIVDFLFCFSLFLFFKQLVFVL